MSVWTEPKALKIRTLALDISTVATGWAIMDNDKIVKVGVISSDKGLSDSARYYLITHTIKGIIIAYKPTDLAVEDTFYAKDPTVLKKLSRLAGQAMYLWFKMSGKTLNFYMAMSSRKSFPGLTGRSSKDEIVVAVNKHFKLRGRLKDNNAADALVTGYHHYVKSVELDTEHTEIKKKSRKARKTRQKK